MHRIGEASRKEGKRTAEKNRPEQINSEKAAALADTSQDWYVTKHFQTTRSRI